MSGRPISFEMDVEARIFRRLLLTLLVMLAAVMPLSAQSLSGQVLDAATGESLPMADVFYEGRGLGVRADLDGRFTIERKVGWTLKVSVVGFETAEIKITSKTSSPLKIRLKERVSQIGELVVSADRKRYSRKNNPAVELMKRVIEAKKKTSLERFDYYQFDKYQKIVLSLNDYRPGEIDSTRLKRFNWRAQTEVSAHTGKIIMPLSIEETVTKHVYRRDPQAEKDIVLGQQSRGVNQLLLTGDMVNKTLREVFKDVDIYEDDVYLLQHPLMSPIADRAISFYRYFIEDTLVVDGHPCYHLNFRPNNLQDFGFSGELFVRADSSLHVVRCVLSLPKQSDVNFVDRLHIDLSYEQWKKPEDKQADAANSAADGEWVLTKDEMWAELRVVGLKLLAVRTTNLKDYAFDPLPKSLFRGKAEVRYVANSRSRDDDFWNEYRATELSEKEASVGNFMESLKQYKAMRIPLFIVKAIGENYIETGPRSKPSKVDLGPVMSTFSTNYVDGFRLRLGARTMGALNHHWFVEGFGAYGFKSKQFYYDVNLTYSLNRKENSSFEFPQRNIVFESTHDVMSVSDKFLVNDKDNLLAGIRTERVDKMYTYDRQKLSFVYETEGGLALSTALKAERDRVAGKMQFLRLSDGTEQESIRTTEYSVGLRYAPGKTYINTKQNRFPLNFDNPEVSINHTTGFKGFLGGEYNMNLTELNFFKRQWLGSWGHLDFRINAAAQWNKLPFPLLLTPPTSVSYIEQGGTFNLLHNMEFFMDRRLFFSVSWDMNGKLLNRIPLLKKLKFREYFAFKGVWGYLTDKNNPTLASNAGDETLFMLPEGSSPIDPKRPYMEVVVGLHNILKFFSVDWVHRVNYNEREGTHKNGVRFGFQFSF